MVRSTCGSFASSSCARVGIEQRGVGSEMRSRTSATDGKLAADPAVLDEAGFALRRRDRHVGAEAARSELRFGPQCRKVRHRRRGDEVQRRVVREPARHHQLADVDDGLVVRERGRGARGSRVSGRSVVSVTRPPQGLGEARVGGAAVARGLRAVGPDDADRAAAGAPASGGLTKSAASASSAAHFFGVLALPHPAAGPVDHGVGAIPQYAALGNHGLVELAAGPST